MAFMMVTGYCAICQGVFSFNPDLVPSLTVAGFREPICKSCIERANPIRVSKGMIEIKILPGAYEPQEIA